MKNGIRVWVGSVGLQTVCKSVLIKHFCDTKLPFSTIVKFVGSLSKYPMWWEVAHQSVHCLCEKEQYNMILF